MFLARAGKKGIKVRSTARNLKLILIFNFLLIEKRNKEKRGEERKREKHVDLPVALFAFALFSVRPLWIIQREPRDIHANRIAEPVILRINTVNVVGSTVVA